MRPVPPPGKKDPSSPGRRVTQADIARAARVTQATVSLALRNHPGVSPPTRDRILGLVRDLGYQPDPYLSGLAAYRQKHRSQAYHATLAWLSSFPKPGGWRYWPAFVDYYEGSFERAAELGYKLEEYALRGGGISPARLQQILLARNIRGLLLPPQPLPDAHLSFGWQHFSAVTFGYSLVEPALHLVTLHHFRSMEIVFRRLVSLGYRRPGLALSRESDDRSDHMLSAAFWSEQQSLPARDRVPMLRPGDLDGVGLLHWYRKHKPDVIVAIRPEVHGWLKDAGIGVPEKVGLAMLSVPDDSPFSGIQENSRLAGRKAVEMLIGMVQHGERGVPGIPVRLLIEGTWVQGKTVRAGDGPPAVIRISGRGVAKPKAPG